jgi:hypothetical protein
VLLAVIDIDGLRLGFFRITRARAKLIWVFYLGRVGVYLDGDLRAMVSACDIV